VTRPRKLFNGSLEQLQRIVATAGPEGAWEHMPTSYWRYRANSGAILNYWPTTGTFNFQGPAAAARDFEHAICRAVSGQRLLEGPR
jgi:hypothetical protein